MTDSAATATPATLTVKKRTGQQVPFFELRILRAVEHAWKAHLQIPHESALPAEPQAQACAVADRVVAWCRAEGARSPVVFIEDIQDAVVRELRAAGHGAIAEEYTAYRRRHDQRRFEAERLTIQKRDGRVVAFKPEKIAIALGKAFAAGRPDGRLSTADQEVALRVADLVVEAIRAEAPSSARTLHIEAIQDLAERTLNAMGHREVAARYHAYRDARRQARDAQPPVAPPLTQKEAWTLKTEGGGVEPLDLERLKLSVAAACRGLEDHVSVEAIVRQALANGFDGMTTAQLSDAILMAARGLIEEDPTYRFVAARWLLRTVYRDAAGRPVALADMAAVYPQVFVQAVRQAVGCGRLVPAMLEFDLERLGRALRPERDFQFGYMGLQTLYDRYFLHQEGRRLEAPQMFWMRIAMGLALNEGEARHERALEFYEVMSTFRYIPSTPTLFNAGTRHPQLSSCFLTTVPDDLDGIFSAVRDNALLSKWSGGLGNDWTPVRALGSHIEGTNGKSQGVVPFLKVANDTAVAVNQCFSPGTVVFTAEGIKGIEEINVRDLVLGRSGRYREVLDRMTYRQRGRRMVAMKIKHALRPLVVSDSHPFWVVQGVPMEMNIARTLEWLEKGKVAAKWVEVGKIRQGDYVAQVIPMEVIPVAGLTVDDVRMYGILLGDGHMARNGREWGVSGNPTCDAHMPFVRNYLRKRGVHFWEHRRNARYGQIRWTSGYGGASAFPFDRADLYDAQGKKHIARRFAHLPPAHTLALIQGLLETDGGVSRGAEIYFTNVSMPLIEGLRYQLLRLGVPTAGQYRVRRSHHVGTRLDGSRIRFKGMTKCYDVRIPAVPEIARLVGCRPIAKHNWFVWNGSVFTRVRSVREVPPVPVVHDLKVEGDESYMTAAALVHNGGKRQGAVCAYLETWHLDIEEFLELRKNTGDERRRTHDMHTAAWIPDLFMKRVLANADWTLFSPQEAPDLHDLYGRAFERRYEQYETEARAGRLRQAKTVSAVELWRKLLSMLFETGHPWITFKDPANIRSPQDHAGVVHSSNLCTEILLNTSQEETAVCNLGSVNLAEHTTAGGLDGERVGQTVRIAMRMLDNVIDLNYYPTPQARTSNQRHRPVGLGLMGFQDALYLQGVSYASPQAVAFADESMELIAYHAIMASAALAAERGAYPSFEGSKWARGLLPHDTIALLAQERGGHVTVPVTPRLDWAPVREAIRRHGLRNSNTMAIAPTATIANIAGVTASIEPTYKNLYVKSNLSGEFTMGNPYLVEELQALGLWDAAMRDDLKYFDGALQEIPRIPQTVKDRYATAFEIGYEWLIECASRRQIWMDMGQSLNLYMAEASGKKLHTMYLLAWERGLKTTYYLRSLGATRVEKATLDVNKYGDPLGQKTISPRAPAPPAVALDPVACRITSGDACEACQ